MTIAKPRLILGSASPRRLDLLAQAGITPDLVQPADIDETPHRNEPPTSYCLRIAKEKNDVLARQFPDDFVLTADTTGKLGRRILGKAETREEAEKMLRMISGRTLTIVTAVVLYAPARDKPAAKVNLTKMKIKRLSEPELKNYLALNEWQSVAGAFKYQGAFGAFVTDIQGSPSGIIGLPLYETMQLLKGAGYDYPL